MTVKEIVKKYLEDKGYDGLVDPLFSCTCNLNNLMWCGEDYITECMPHCKEETERRREK